MSVVTTNRIAVCLPVLLEDTLQLPLMSVVTTNRIAFSVFQYYKKTLCSLLTTFKVVLVSTIVSPLNH